MRLSQVALLIIVIALIAILIFPGRQILGFRIPTLGAILRQVAPGEEEAPPTCKDFDFTQLMPTSWDFLRVDPLNIDGDDETECLVIFRYDKTPHGFGGPLGGAIYDPQPNRDPRNLATEFPFRPSAYIAYQLLPRHGGMGFLGEEFRGQERPRVDVYDVDGDGVNELVIRGYSGYDRPTSLAIFEWVTREKGYRVMTSYMDAPLWGDAGIVVQPEPPNGPIAQVIVRQRLYDPPYYARSQLASRMVYSWDATTNLLYQTDSSLDFAFGRPQGAETSGQQSYPVMYPEEALLAYYDEGEVEIISLLGGKEAEGVGIVDAEVIVKVEEGGTRTDKWTLVKLPISQVGEMTRWELHLRQEG